MTFTNAQISEMLDRRDAVVLDLQRLMLRFIAEGEASDNPRVKEHLVHGAGRRLRVVERAAASIFELFPPTTEEALPSETLANVQLSLHALLIHLYGIFDNLAWAFVHQHDLLNAVGDRRSVGLFKKATRRHLPDEIVDYISDHAIATWYGDYLTTFRDALVHRIPPYIPPAEFTEEDGRRFNEIESQKVAALRAGDIGRVEALRTEQAHIGKPCFYFLHSFSERESRRVQLHPQCVSDSMTIVEFGGVFLDHWHSMA